MPYSIQCPPPGLRVLSASVVNDDPMPDLLKQLIRDVPDFPKPGIMYKDITPLLANPAGLALAVELMANPHRNKEIDLVVGAESRGFIFGTAIAQALNCGFVPVRKPGKLPAEKRSIEYDLEYGTDILEIHTDAVGHQEERKRVLMVDDLLATGGTMKACCELVSMLEADIVGVAVLIELAFLNGRGRLSPHEVTSVIQY